MVVAMSTKRINRTNRLLIGAVAVIGILAGAAGIAAAVTGDEGSGPAAVLDRGDDDRGDDDRGEDRGDDDPTAEQAASLRDGAAVGQEDAEATARAEAPGTIHRTEIEDEDGRVVWDVEIDGDDGSRHDIQVDATSGEIVEHDIDDD
jgi:uncharacterized membrane protein YkoI